MSVSFVPPNKRGNPPPSQATIQKMLDENSQLINTIVERQQQGRAQEAMQYQQLLHRNLVYLATIADSSQSNFENILQGSSQTADSGAQNHPASSDLGSQSYPQVNVAPGMNTQPRPALNQTASYNGMAPRHPNPQMPGNMPQNAGTVPQMQVNNAGQNPGNSQMAANPQSMHMSAAGQSSAQMTQQPQAASSVQSSVGSAPMSNPQMAATNILPAAQAQGSGGGSNTGDSYQQQHGANFQQFQPNQPQDQSSFGARMSSQSGYSTSQPPVYQSSTQQGQPASTFGAQYNPAFSSSAHNVPGSQTAAQPGSSGPNPSPAGASSQQPVQSFGQYSGQTVGQQHNSQPQTMPGQTSDVSQFPQHQYQQAYPTASSSSTAQGYAASTAPGYQQASSQGYQPASSQGYQPASSQGYQPPTAGSQAQFQQQFTNEQYQQQQQQF